MKIGEGREQERTETESVQELPTQGIPLRELRKRLRLTQAEADERAGHGKGWAERIERQELGKLGTGTLAAYLAALGYRLELVAVREGERFRIG
ncbi:hypothetical protein VR44_06530 [Streptomyces katrae]|uniref:HTH cro/C1-type domain-containing protein n=1 Tax=Streptomyces katrae TaxID=68223 RepID=A0A0F4JRW9_9ACTN|nr:hypothetical protein VR44_06530 [Streptomyces katrae]